MIPGKTNSKPNTARRARHNRPWVRWSRIPGCSFAVPRRPVNATEPRRRCHGRVAKAPTRWPSFSMPAGEGSTGQSKNTGMIYSKRYNKTCFNSSLPGQKGHNFTDDFSNEFTWIKSFILWFNFYWCLFLRAQLTNKHYQAICTISSSYVNSNWSYSPETPNLGQIRRFWEPCDLEIWRMTFKNNRAPFLCYFKLCAAFHSHWWIQNGVTVRKRPIWVKFDDF